MLHWGEGRLGLRWLCQAEPRPQILQTQHVRCSRAQIDSGRHVSHEDTRRALSEHVSNFSGRT